MKRKVDAIEKSPRCDICYDEEVTITKCLLCTFYMCDSCKSHLAKRTCPQCSLHLDTTITKVKGRNRYQITDPYSVYIGQLNRKTLKAHGYGHYRDTEVFQRGYFKNGDLHGYCVLKFANKDKYEGHCSNNHYNGYGTFEFSDGGSYHGQWLDSKRHGKGTYSSKRQIYIGEWQDGLKHGEGREFHYDPFGTHLIKRYIGGWNKGRYDGHGELFERGNFEYVGEFQHNRKHGSGVLTKFGKGKYTGEFKYDYLSGDGIFEFTDGSTLEGFFDQGCFVAGKIVAVGELNLLEINERSLRHVGPLEIQPGSVITYEGANMILLYI